jgi:hypothetical protein
MMAGAIVVCNVEVAAVMVLRMRDRNSLVPLRAICSEILDRPSRAAWKMSQRLYLSTLTVAPPRRRGSELLECTLDHTQHQTGVTHSATVTRGRSRSQYGMRISLVDFAPFHAGEYGLH